MSSRFSPLTRRAFARHPLPAGERDPHRRSTRFAQGLDPIQITSRAGVRVILHFVLARMILGAVADLFGTIREAWLLLNG